MEVNRLLQLLYFAHPLIFTHLSRPFLAPFYFFIFDVLRENKRCAKIEGKKTLFHLHKFYTLKRHSY